MKIYVRVRQDRVLSGMLHTRRCPKCGVAIVEADGYKNPDLMLDTRHQKEEAGVIKALVHQCEKKRRKPRKDELWD